MKPLPAASALALVITTCVFAAPPEKKTPPASKPGKATTSVPINRLKVQLDETETAIVELLAANQAADPKVQALKLNYRMVLRRLYEAALSSKSEDLRAQLALRADQLSAGTPAFDAMVSRVPEWNSLISKAGPSPEQQKIKSQLAAATASIAAFDKATASLPQDIADSTTLRKFLADTIGTLEPALKVSLNDAPLPSAWPELATKGTARAETPTLGETQMRIQQAAVLPALRSEMLAVLPQLKIELETPQTAAEAEKEYRVLLDTLSLAEQLGSSTALTPEAQADLNERLRKAMILFKDARTRASATTRLAGVADIASTLAKLEKSTFSAAQKSILGDQVTRAVQATAIPATAKAARQTLSHIDRLASTYDSFTRGIDQPTLTAAAPDWKKIRTSGETHVTNLLDKFTTDPDNAKLEDTVKRLDAVVKNFDTLALMPSLVKRAESLKPKLGASVERKLNVLSRAIADSPDVSGAAAEDVRSIAGALSALETARSEMPAEADAISIAGDRYRPFMARFTETETKLLTALALPTAVLPPLTAQLNADARLLKATSQLLSLQKSEIVERLNRWGAWQLDPSAKALLNTELTRAVANAYVTATGGLPLVEASVSTTTAADAITVLVESDRRLSPKLAPKQPATSWALPFSSTARTPTAQAILGNLDPRTAIVCFHLNEAAINADQGGPEETVTLHAKKAIEKLASLLPDVQSSPVPTGGPPQ